MSIELINGFADDALKRYRSFALSIVGLLNRTMDKPDGITALSLDTFKRDVSTVALTHARSEYDIVYRNSEEVLLKAVSDAYSALDKTVEAVDYDLQYALSATMDDLYNSIESQVAKDARTAAKRLRRMAIQSSMIQSQRGWTSKASLIAVRESEKGSINFEFSDKSGRAWASDRYMKVLLRGHYLNLYNETYMFVLSKFQNEAVMTSDSDDKLDILFRIVDSISNSILPTYKDLIDGRVIHPNSSYIVSKG